LARLFWATVYVPLDQARQKAIAARDTLRSKVDPLDARRAEQAVARVTALKQLTFSEAARSFIEQNDVKWKNPPSRAWCGVSAWSFTLHCMEAARIAPALFALRQRSKNPKSASGEATGRKGLGR
jgi:hypothetical protein